jgi:hypothetical protein
MINEMVHFSVILRRASKQIYHDSKGLTLFEKSAVALELDTLLENWRSNLPPWLNLDVKSLREPEWASKQKLVLQLSTNASSNSMATSNAVKGYLNARILLHRPFLASSASTNFLQLERNIGPCLDAARKTIDLLYEAYEQRHYFRTWYTTRDICEDEMNLAYLKNRWYNSTYTLYAGMIILYIILLNYTKIPGDELLRDVEKSREILLAMEEASVAQRSAKLIGEVLEVARAYISQRCSSHNTHQEPPSSMTSGARNNNVLLDLENYDSSTMDNFGDSDWSEALFAYNVPSSSRGDILATLIDPNLLQDFAAGTNEYSTTRSVASANSVSGAGMGGGYYSSPDYGGGVPAENQAGELGTDAQWNLPWGAFSEPMHLQTGIW